VGSVPEYTEDTKEEWNDEMMKIFAAVKDSDSMIKKFKKADNQIKGSFTGLARALQLAVDKYYTTGKRADYKQAVLIQAELVEKFKDNKPYVKEVIKKLASIYKNVKPGKKKVKK
jgi:hypothetical protein